MENRAEICHPMSFEDSTAEERRRLIEAGDQCKALQAEYHNAMGEVKTEIRTLEAIVREGVGYVAGIAGVAKTLSWCLNPKGGLIPLLLLYFGRDILLLIQNGHGASVATVVGAIVGVPTP